LGGDKDFECGFFYTDVRKMRNLRIRVPPFSNRKLHKQMIKNLMELVK
jgi:hypothetical protein